jgi:homoserine O-acetyltransferase
MGLCTQFYKEEAWRRVGFSSLDDFLTGFWENWFLPQDPNNLLAMLSKWRRGDVAGGGDLKKVLSKIRAKIHVIAFEEDMFVPVQDCKAEQKMIPGSRLIALPSLWGHFATIGLFPEDAKQLDQTLEELLSA